MIHADNLQASGEMGTDPIPQLTHNIQELPAASQVANKERHSHVKLLCIGLTWWATIWKIFSLQMQGVN